MSRTALQRFWAKVDPDGPAGCWLWLAGHDRLGYGKFHLGRDLAAHQAAYELFIGPVPEGLELDHLCRTRACVNPSHLEPVTHRENTLRGQTVPAANAAKTHCPQGHAYDEANTYYWPSTGERQCRACRRERIARYRQNLTEASA